MHAQMGTHTAAVPAACASRLRAPAAVLVAVWVPARPCKQDASTCKWATSDCAHAQMGRQRLCDTDGGTSTPAHAQTGLLAQVGGARTCVCTRQPFLQPAGQRATAWYRAAAHRLENPALAHCRLKSYQTLSKMLDQEGHGVTLDQPLSLSTT